MGGWARLLHRLWGIVSSYGYRPQRAILGLAVLIALSGFAFAFPEMQPTSDIRPQFWSALYATDLALPLVDLDVAESYQPRDGWAQWAMWATIAAGWFLSGAFLAAVTGIFKADD